MGKRPKNRTQCREGRGQMCVLGMDYEFKIDAFGNHWIGFIDPHLSLLHRRQHIAEKLLLCPKNAVFVVTGHVSGADMDGFHYYGVGEMVFGSLVGNFPVWVNYQESPAPRMIDNHIFAANVCIIYSATPSTPLTPYTQYMIVCHDKNKPRDVLPGGTANEDEVCEGKPQWQKIALRELKEKTGLVIYETRAPWCSLEWLVHSGR